MRSAIIRCSFVPRCRVSNPGTEVAGIVAQYLFDFVLKLTLYCLGIARILSGSALFPHKS